MKRLLATAILLLCVACATDRVPKAFTLPSDVKGPFPADSFWLPHLEVSGVTYQDGLQTEEVKTLSSEYSQKLVGLCGGPETPEENEDWWMVTCGTGYVWREVGRLWLSKNGSNVVYEVTGIHKSDKTRHVVMNLRYSFGGQAAGGKAE